MTADDEVTAALEKAQKIADGLHFACRDPNRIPDFFGCGGPAAEAYWDYFTPARISSFVAAIEAVLKLTEPRERRDYDLDGNWEGPVQIVIPAAKVREAITAELTGAQLGEDGNHARLPS